MNDLLKKFAEQAKKYALDAMIKITDKEQALKVYSESYDTKFAELIVRECIEQLRYTVLNTQELRRDKSTDYQVGWEDGMFDAKEMIKEHFGVEL
jgi:hypothetical protein